MQNIPSKLVLTCTVSGKVVTWTNKTIIANKIKQFGSLDAFIKQFTCRGFNKAINNISKPVNTKTDITKLTLTQFNNNIIFKDGLYSVK